MKLGKFPKILLIILGVITLLLATVQIALNSPLPARILRKLASENVDAKVELSGIDISLFRRFPKVSVSVDTLIVTYPHERFARFDSLGAPSRLRGAGRGELADTLLSLDRLSASANPLRLFEGVLRLSDAQLNSVHLFAHQFDSTSANWKIFRTKEKESADTSSLGALPWISVGQVRIAKRPRIVYTSQSDTIFAALSFSNFTVQGDVKADLENKIFKVRDFALNLDTFRMAARLPADTLAFRLDSLRISSPTEEHLDFEAGAKAYAFTKAFGRLELPVYLCTRLKYTPLPSAYKFEIPLLNADIAYVPFEADGTLVVSDQTEIDARISLHDCNLGQLMRKYADSFLPQAKAVSTDACLFLQAEAKGFLGNGALPDLNVAVQIPKSRLDYLPLGLKGNLTADLDASMTSRKVIDARVHKLIYDAPQMNVNVNASARDVLGKNGFFSVKAKADADLEKMASLFKLDSLFSATGLVKLNLSADVRRPEIDSMRFDKSKIKASLYSDRIRFTMPSDTLRLRLSNTALSLDSSPEGLYIVLGLDTLRYRQGHQMRARLCQSKTSATLTKAAAYNGQLVPRLSLQTDNGDVYARLGDIRARFDSLFVGAALQKRVKRTAPRRQFKLPGYMTDSTFAGSNVSFSLDSAATGLLEKWNPSGEIMATGGLVSLPGMPLRTVLDTLDAKFDVRSVNLNSLRLSCGTSDFSAKGKLIGLRSLLMSKKGMGMMKLDIESERLNLNELLLALQNRNVKGDTVQLKTDEGTESFKVVDSIQGQAAGFPLIVVPANIAGQINLKAKNVEYLSLAISPFESTIQMRRRTLLMRDTWFDSNVGRMSLDAYYATRSKSDISCGINLGMRDISANGIIQMIPSVNTLLPVLQSFEGRFNCCFAATTQLDTSMNVIMPSLDGLFRITGENLKISDAGDLRKITKMLRFKNVNIGNIDNMSVDMVINGNKLAVFPFELGVDRYKFALTGAQGFDKTMNYHISILKNPILNIPFGININGTTDKWKFTIGAAQFKNGHVPAYTKQLDTVQVNLGRSIKGVLEKGVGQALSYTRQLQKMERSREFGSVPLNKATFRQLDSLDVQLTLQAEQEALDKQVADALSETVVDTALLMKEYEQAEMPGQKRRKNKK